MMRRILPVVVIFLAWVMRVLALATLPPGMDRDTAQNGVYTLYMLYQGLRPIFYRAGAPEPLIVYLQAMSVALFGVSVFSLTIVTAIIGTLTIPALYAYIRALKIDWRIAAIAALGLAMSIEHAYLSRLGLRAIFIPLVEILVLNFFWRAWQYSRPRDYLLLGVTLGIGYYTYLSAIFLPLILITLIAHQCVFNRAHVKTSGRGLIGAAILGLIIASPLVVFEIQYPNAAFGRASQVTLLQNPVVSQIGVAGALLFKIWSQIKMFGFEWQGQYNPFSLPLLDPIWLALFAVGLVVCVRRMRRLEFGWAIIALGVMLLPDLIGGNEEFPHELRVLGIFPPVFFIGAVGATAIIDGLKRWQTQVAYSAVGLILLISASSNFNAFLIEWNHLAQITDNDNFNRATVAEGNWIAQMNTAVLVPLNEYARQPVRYLIGKRAPNLRAANENDLRNIGSVLVVQPVDNNRPRFEGRAYAHDPSVFVLVKDDTVLILPPLAWILGSQTQPVATIRDERGDLDAQVYSADARALTIAPTPATPRAQFASGITLIDATINSPRVLASATIDLTLRWSCAAHLSADYIIFTHLLDADGNFVSGVDTTPALGAYPTFIWKPGEIVTTHYRIPVPKNSAPGKYSIEVGLYNALNENRLDTLDANGNPSDSRVVVGAIKVAPSATNVYTPTQSARANFDQQIELQGFDLPAVAQAGNPVAITLHWRALAAMPNDYTLFAHLLDAQNQIVAQSDHQPQAGRYPTSIWDANEQVRDDFTLDLPDDLPNGKYKLEIGWYDLQSGTRLALLDNNHQSIGDSLVLDQTLEITK